MTTGPFQMTAGLSLGSEALRLETQGLVVDAERLWEEESGPFEVAVVLPYLLNALGRDLV
jgi:hypothetical protein